MNKAELIEALADKTGLQKQEAKKVLDAYIEIVTERMSENEEIVLVGFGTLIPRPQTQRLARNPKTGTPEKTHENRQSWRHKFHIKQVCCRT